jgi:hypothetical protein
MKIDLYFLVEFPIRLGSASSDSRETASKTGMISSVDPDSVGSLLLDLPPSSILLNTPDV